MFFPIFTTIGLMLAIFSVYMRHSGKNIKKINDEFWDKELKANSVRKQPLTDIEYIDFDPGALPFDEETDDENIRDYQDKLKSLAGKKIVNLSGITNTDLKLKYGVANLDYLSSCDENFLELVKYLYLLSDYLYDKGDIEKSRQILEYGVSIHTDVRAHYRLLADILAKDFDFEGIERLTEEAKKITSPTRDSIVEMLKSTDYFSGEETLLP